MAPAGLAGLARALGGEAWDGGRRAVIPGPGHGAADRSVSLLLRGERVVVHSFAGDDWREVLASLRALGWIDGEARLTGGGASSTARLRTPHERVAIAGALWDAAAPVRHGPAARYLQRRAIRRPAGDALRAHPQVPAAIYAARGPRRSALLAAITAPDGRLCGVEVTRLEVSGQLARGRAPRRTVGQIAPGAAVRLDPPGEALLVGEGVCTCLSASERFGLPAWALLSVGNLRGWTPPPGVREVVIAADRDPPGRAAAAQLSSRLRAGGLRTRMLIPPAPFGDWNDVAQAEAVA